MSEYLTESKAFGDEIEAASHSNRVLGGTFGFRSPRLVRLTAAIKLYIAEKSPVLLEDVNLKFSAWRANDPKEFRHWRWLYSGTDAEKDFEAELEQAFENADLIGAPDRPTAATAQIPRGASVAINRHRWLKKAAVVGMKAADAGISVAEEATKASLVVLVTAGGAALGATGIGLVAGGLVLSSVQSVLALRSAVKTNRHLEALQRIYLDREGLNRLDPCKEILQNGTLQHTRWCRISHDVVAEHVLPYIIHKKTSKYYRKSVTGVVPIVGGLSISSYGALHKLYKLARGTAGVNRKNSACWLAEHFCRCDCPLSNTIVAALYSVEEMHWLLRECEYDVVADYLERKMQST